MYLLHRTCRGACIRVGPVKCLRLSELALSGARQGAGRRVRESWLVALPAVGDGGLRGAPHPQAGARMTCSANAPGTVRSTLRRERQGASSRLTGPLFIKSPVCGEPKKRSVGEINLCVAVEHMKLSD